MKPLFPLALVAFTLAGTIEGEAGTCPIEAKYAVARIYQVNSVMFGWTPPTAESLFVALTWPFMPDYSHGARFLMSASDLRLPEVQSFVGGEVASWDCADGRSLHAMAAKQLSGTTGQLQAPAQEAK